MEWWFEVMTHSGQQLKAQTFNDLLELLFYMRVVYLHCYQNANNLCLVNFTNRTLL